LLDGTFKDNIAIKSEIAKSKLFIMLYLGICHGSKPIRYASSLKIK
jgi:hypothetical protein